MYTIAYGIDKSSLSHKTKAKYLAHIS